MESDPDRSILQLYAHQDPSTPTNSFVNRPNGIIFEISSSDILESSSLSKGDVVTFAYDNYSRAEEPVNPKILRVRKDLTWEQVLEESEREINSQGTNMRYIYKLMPHYQEVQLNRINTGPLKRVETCGDFLRILQDSETWTPSRQKLGIQSLEIFMPRSR